MTSIPFRRSLIAKQRGGSHWLVLKHWPFAWLLGKLRESGLPGAAGSVPPAIQPAPGSGTAGLGQKCPSSCLGWGYPAPWFPFGGGSALATSAAPFWQPGKGLGIPGSLSGYWKEKMSAWQLKGPKNGNLSCCLIWKNLILFWWVFFLISCL